MLEPITRQHLKVLKNDPHNAELRDLAVKAHKRSVAISALLNDTVRLIGTKLPDVKGEGRSWNEPYKTFTQESETSNYITSNIVSGWTADRSKIKQHRTQLRIIPAEWKVRLEERVKQAARRVFQRYRSHLLPDVELVYFAEECRVVHGRAFVPWHYAQTERLAQLTGLGEKWWLLGSNKIGHDAESNSTTYRIFYASAESVGRGHSAKYIYSSTKLAYVIVEDTQNSPVWGMGADVLKARAAYQRALVKAFTSTLQTRVAA